MSCQTLGSNRKADGETRGAERWNVQGRHPQGQTQPLATRCQQETLLTQCSTNSSLKTEWVWGFAMELESHAVVSAALVAQQLAKRVWCPVPLFTIWIDRIWPDLRTRRKELCRVLGVIVELP